MKKPLLSILILSSGRVSVETTLESIEMFVRDKVDTEVIIVNTSGKNVSHTVKTYADKVVEYRWNDDFSAARNAGIKKATGRWLLYLDDDEFFIDAQPLVDFLLLDDGSYHWGNMYVYNFLDPQLKTYDDVVVSRLIRLTADTHFEGVIHEMFAPTIGNAKLIGAKIGHTGYLYRTNEERKAHYERNIRLVATQLANDPTNPRWWVQMLQEYCSIGDYETVCKLSEKYIHVAKKIKQTADNADEIQNLIGLFVVFFLYSLLELNCYDDAYSMWIKHARGRDYGLVANAQLYIIGASILYHKKLYVLAEKQCIEYMKCFNKYVGAENEYSKYMVSVLCQTFGKTNLTCVQEMAKKFADLNI